MKRAFTILFLFVSTLVLAQEINQLDTNGKYHGIWKKNFDGTSILRYEGAFSHGKEIGVFKFYKNIKKKAVLTATKEFNETDNKAYVKFFASTGKVISEGQMDGKKYIGEWKYYQKTNNKLLTLEHYNDSGSLNGERTVYYPSGQLAEKQIYKNGKLDGVSVMYSNKNVLLSELIYVNGELHGYSKYYSPKAELVAEGLYKNDKKDGIWKYYKDGKLTEEKNFSYIPKYIKKTP
ncbi:toxin-antitoxin system YwqK family antitoxin [Mariniflexile litorale]|uniref:Toxin-antitoxin system YwqK family antitoxin n=1 Tax=Mariniflexile litorale TaxID=3045158 RepID=A0AAU7EF62_9FLAO|nr:toxin-antitoxin system YwqK family antitoxin [Mariniflexile sp. KMM 9835]MDQ8211623.1 toxin-antitoxin system YwqK family antitoxin [Mariniflexile sp. KMM 9835]